MALLIQPFLDVLIMQRIARSEALTVEKRMTREERRSDRGFLKSALLLIPDFLKLLFRLLKDGRVPMAEKAMLIGTVVYVVSPLDLLPDFIPFLGQLDDIYLVSIVLLRLLSRTPADVVNEHWDGRGDLSNVVAKIYSAARYFLPSRVRRILLGRVEIGSSSHPAILTSPGEPESIERHRKEKLRR
jgi:uncharacterized membrane protein YkvA (DUF1232 family)